MSTSFSFFKGTKGILLTLCLVSTFICVVGLDQVSKIHAHETLLAWEDAENTRAYRGGRHWIGSIGTMDYNPDSSAWYGGLKFQYSRNWGAAFSMLSDMSDSFRVPFFYGVTVVAIIMIAFYLRGAPLHNHMTRYGLVLILAGAVGNFIDRFRLGYVIDFIDVDWKLYLWRHDFAIFNVADMAINAGVILLITDLLIHRNEELEQETATASN